MQKKKQPKKLPNQKLKRTPRPNQKKRNLVTVTCPKCHETWATISLAVDSYDIDPENITVIKGEGKKKFEDGDVLMCSCCKYQYTTWDMFLALSSPETPKPAGVPPVEEGEL